MIAKNASIGLFICFTLVSCASAESESVVSSNEILTVETKINAPTQESIEVAIEVPEEFKSYFSSCSGIPSWEEKNQDGREVVVGYCEVNGEKFTSFTIDNSKDVQKDNQEVSQEVSANSTTETNGKADNIESKSKNSGTKKEFSLVTVPLGTQGHPFYLSTRNFPSVGQSFALESPITLKSIGVHINQRVTLLTPEGVELFRQDPTGMSLSFAKANEVEKAVFDKTY